MSYDQQRQPMYHNNMPNGMPPQMNANGAQSFYPHTPHMPPANNLAPPVNNLVPPVNNLAPPVNNLPSSVNNLAAPTVQKMPPQMNLVNGSGTSTRTASPAFGGGIPPAQLPPQAWQRTPMSASVASQSTFNNNVTSAPQFAPLKTSTPNQSFNLTPGMQNMTLNSNYTSPQQVPLVPRQQQPFNGQPQQPLQYQSQQYPVQQQPQQFQQHPFVNNVTSAAHAGFNRLWGNETVDLLENRHILPPGKVQPPPIRINQQLQESVNCSPE